ncbi:hypothetical protein NDU88_002473 [Pleurodeles waltl]|uniref:Uncharacterized protein n=1 Tax=Pleurodeles waltl TaxID=8319 RepID=A0AAV7W296_PLEWA|nr:hypothetical protein NDU88_002473 [Pleurodeles waltl]
MDACECSGGARAGSLRPERRTRKPRAPYGAAGKRSSQRSHNPVRGKKGNGGKWLVNSGRDAPAGGFRPGLHPSTRTHPCRRLGSAIVITATTQRLETHLKARGGDSLHVISNL